MPETRGIMGVKYHEAVQEPSASLVQWPAIMAEWLHQFWWFFVEEVPLDRQLTKSKFLLLLLNHESKSWLSARVS